MDNLPPEVREALDQCYEEVDAVFRKWGVAYSPGCGCCDGGAIIKDANGKYWFGDLKGFGE